MPGGNTSDDVRPGLNERHHFLDDCCVPKHKSSPYGRHKTKKGILKWCAKLLHSSQLEVQFEETPATRPSTCLAASNSEISAGLRRAVRKLVTYALLPSARSTMRSTSTWGGGQ
jgi:hypothetical protein